MFSVFFKAKMTLRKTRLNACGSAALPDTVLDAWMELSGHVSKIIREGGLQRGWVSEKKGVKSRVMDI